MSWNTPESIKEIMLKLVGCSSIAGTKEEAKMGEEIYSLLNEIQYFKDNPEYLELNRIPNDNLGRYVVTALLKGKGDKTVILFGHHDIVDYDGYGNYKDLALDPIKLTESLDPDILPEDARRDLLSGEWLFGRGTMDMKCGIALEIALVEEISHGMDDFEGNIIFLSVPDEENNSAGMLAAIPMINRLKEKYGLDCLSYVITEPQQSKVANVFPLYTGGTGKLLPIFYCMGKETHASKVFGGLSADSLLGDIEREIQLSTDFVDSNDGSFTTPPTVLSMRDERKYYNVSTPSTAYAYINVFTLQFTPEEIMEKLKGVANRAFDNTLSRFKSRVKSYKEITGEDHPCPWETKVFTYEEIYKYNYEHMGESFITHMDNFIKENKDNVNDEREFAIKVVGEVCRICPDREPKVIIAFAPPYYPHLSNKGETEKEKLLLKVIDNIQGYSKEKYDIRWKHKKYFGISDLSYCGLQNAEEVISMLKPNMPTLGYTYFLPLEEMAKLNLPVINLGPLGADGHKFTERLHMPFSFEILPDLLKFTVLSLLNI